MMERYWVALLIYLAFLEIFLKVGLPRSLYHLSLSFHTINDVHSSLRESNSDRKSRNPGRLPLRYNGLALLAG